MLKVLVPILILFFLPVVQAKERVFSVGLAAIEPYVIDKNGQLGGFDHVFLSELLERAKIKGKFSAWPMERFTAYGAEGRFDIALDMAAKPGMEKNYRELKSIFGIYAMLISGQKKFELKDGVKITVGKPRGIDCEVFSKKQLKNVRFFDWDSIEQGILLLQEGRINALCIDAETFRYRFDQVKKKEFKAFFHPEFSFTFKLSVYVKKTVPFEEREALEKALRDMEKENRHFQKDKFFNN